MRRTDARHVPWLLAVLPLLGFWMYGLFDLDEGFYAAVVSSMLRTGDWITPHYRGEPWFEKPILLYWAAAPFVWLLKNDWSARLPSVLAMLGTYAVASASVRRNIGDLPASWTVVVLGTSFLVAAVARMMMTDALLVLALSAALLAHWEARGGDVPWRLVTAACLGAAVLAKGPVALVLFVPIAGVGAWFEPDLRERFWRGWVPGALVFAGVVALWYVPAYRANPGQFVQEFLIEQNLQRFAGGDQAHRVPLWLWIPYYLPVLLLGMAPWSFHAFRAFSRRPYERYLGVWFFMILAFFTVGGSKLPHYILPAAVPLGMLVAIRLGAAERRIGGGAFASSLVVAALLNAGFILHYRLGHAEVHALARLVPAGETAVAYQMPRRPKGSPQMLDDASAEGAGSFGQLMEELSRGVDQTSHPSLEFILDRVLKDGETLDDLEAAAPAWVLTRTGRLSATDLADLRAAGFSVLPRTPAGIRNYRLYEIR